MMVMRRSILAAIMLLTLLIAAYCGYNIGSIKGYETGYKVGYETGHTYGNQTGFAQGYLIGLFHGNETGFNIGFKYGNSSGYSLGYERGHSVGYEIGYSIGFRDGNSTGFNLGYNLGYEDGYSHGFRTGNLTSFSIGYNLGYEAGYLQGVIDGAGRGFTIRDPTYKEAMTFIEIDQTDKNKYIEGVYTCINFAADFKMNAFNSGYKCGLVYIEFPSGAHALVCFNTIDKGLIFIEPQTDSTMRVEVGIHYWRDNGYLCPWDDTIIRYIIIW
ncbi:MAG: hypothetical protein QXQ42_04595 [Candidatus Bathyarchaeia archaeon]